MKILFVGGPDDGLRQEMQLAYGQTTILRARFKKSDWSQVTDPAYLDDCNPFVPRKVDTYYLQKVFGGLMIASHSSVLGTDIIDRLIRGYRGKRR